LKHDERRKYKVMGYTTNFTGGLNLTPPATEEQAGYINLLAGTRRMKRDVKKLWNVYKGKHGLPQFELSEKIRKMVAKLEAEGVDVSVKTKKDNRTPEEIYGVLGQYFAMGDGNYGGNSSATIIDSNSASGEKSYGSKEIESDPNGQPSLWLQWVLTEDGTRLEWDNGEKFYCYVEWLQYLINHFFSKWNIMLNGDIFWEGEESTDLGKIEVRDNVITVKGATITY